MEHQKIDPNTWLIIFNVWMAEVALAQSLVTISAVFIGVGISCYVFWKMTGARKEA